MNAKKVLTGSVVEAPGSPELRQALADAGLELWQAPEGFWTIRIKDGSSSEAMTLARRRPLASRSR